MRTFAFLVGTVFGFLFGWSSAWVRMQKKLETCQRDLEMVRKDAGSSDWHDRRGVS